MAQPNDRLKLLQRWARGGVDAADPDDLRLKKEVMTIASSSIAVLAIFWGASYIASGYPLSGAISLTYTVIVFASTLHFFRSKRFAFFRFSQQILILWLPFLLMWSLGGFANGSAVMIWAFSAPLAALFFTDLRAATRWFSAFSALLVASAVFDSTFAQWAQPMPRGLNTLYFLMNMGLGFALISLMLYYFVRDRQRAYAELQQSETEIQRLILTDPLTQVPNRRALDRRLVEEMARARRLDAPLCLIMADIDHFKRVNDDYGHAMGDAVLKAFALALQERLREVDFIARFGGEEFLIVLPQTDAATAAEVAERLRAATGPTAVPPMEHPVTASFGVAQLLAGEAVADLLARADAAMYQAKREGRNRVVTATGASAAPPEAEHAGRADLGGA